MANEKRLIDATPLIDECRECMNIEWNKSVYATWAEAEEDFMSRLLDAPTVEAVEVSRLGKLGRLMMPYKGCPRGRIGAYGAVGGNTTVTEIHITELDAIVDVEGDRWIPVLAEDLEKLKARANDAVEVVHGRWAFVGDACVCSVCHKSSIVDYYFCPECGAKMDGDGNG